MVGWASERSVARVAAKERGNASAGARLASTLMGTRIGCEEALVGDPGVVARAPIATGARVKTLLYYTSCRCAQTRRHGIRRPRAITPATLRRTGCLAQAPAGVV